ncbi:hypothetical protein [Aureimonas pseudogalii]|uniref:Uncharacterized protein n=1 Tax=Aureimonas pseudogalii TaxID=1744844 RepID=A0A7W6H3I2_9HYPH|nr:hypothetical protein [Aureimonas pseudogalii]MBB3996918.1 hypothetical protein [Aureimonas pseudogalii]
MHTHPDDPATPRISGSADHPPGAEAPTAPALGPASPALRPSATMPLAGPASSTGAHAPVRPTVPQEDLEEVPDAISPFGPS